MTPRTTVDAPSPQERLGDPAGTDPRLIDVRTPAEYEAGHIPGAVARMPWNRRTTRATTSPMHELAARG